MRLSFLALTLWAAGALGHAALLTVLSVRRRVRTVPWFTAWIVFELVYTAALLVAFKMSTSHGYAVVYWLGVFVEVALQVAVVLEVARYVLHRGGMWVEGARLGLGIAGCVAVLLSFLLAWQMTPAADSVLDAWFARVSLGVTVFLTILFTGVVVVSQQLGLSWRNVVLRESYGVMMWTVVSFVTDSLHAYWATIGRFNVLEDVRMVAYLGSLGYWCVVFWLPEPSLKVPDAVTKLGMEQLRRRLE